MSEPVTRLDEFEEFAAATTPTLLRMATALSADPDIAWDLTQETLYRVWRAWVRIDLVANPRGFATRTLVRLNLNRRRALAREFQNRMKLPHSPAQFVDQQFADALEPALEAALRELTNQQRTAVVCVYLLDRSIAETADLMSCRPSTVKTHLSRGLAHLRSACPHLAKEG